MAVSGEHVVEVQDFEREVVLRSRQVPVLVDFWAPWCGPCRMLGPVLEKLATELDGAFVLAKVNVDNNQPVAAEYRVNGIPDVKLFVDGKPVAGFVGAQRESQVRAFLQANMPSEAQSLVSEAQRAIAGGDTQSARAALEKALEIDPDCATAHLDMARMALGAGDLERAREHAERIPPSADVRETADYIAQAIDLVGEARAIGSEQEVAARLESDPEDVEAYFALGAHRLAAASFREALDAFLALAQRQRKWRDEAARKAMLTVFGLIGVRHPMSDEYRRELMLIY